MAFCTALSNWSLIVVFQAWEHSVGIICFRNLQRLAEDVSDQLAQEIQLAIAGKPAGKRRGCRVENGGQNWLQTHMPPSLYSLLKGECHGSGKRQGHSKGWSLDTGTCSPTTQSMHMHTHTESCQIYFIHRHTQSHCIHGHKTQKFHTEMLKPHIATLYTFSTF